MLTYVHQFIGALTFSVFVESIVVVFLCVFLKKDKRLSLLAVLGTLLTIPYVWFVFPTLFWYSASLALYLGEGSYFLFEAMLYKILGKFNWKQALFFSFLATLASYFLGRSF
ncbi:MAG: hypothetical protein COV32_02170 [Candidatus Yonathbacteria bacterium CG10_big_fil_rev_8_21_14_0_10_43_136]|uniref:Uncharacterized protein n=2 Tax=Parcubacteria group TaxID=1794811 RepID=A0A2M7Q4P2_9BACT|nr:MAG: hypothetical protein AUK15_00565 [Candidatus Nomurabacteria bacterium CG2_30_43_9]PIQ35829.1 MAG: hypothetical protein COW60_02150 [Candidatus Yonathbacteria bacterium CG17_big_fil_post_rev_8_21_14_2_50_43_9]PIR40642.1 MAG: hypothetical protein COV32_02170 [Candidatus Yonathbacteria bacterium CG10_big_fil_rev_8_21_14_0_10_43_136]PIX57226.1 MAG: hypothetical protein COZ48_01690 [Candidatus Yonathbacteria bacterium CG_4_10_14_3_um_filter_43_12]PIY58378.1 MAG: hypothetical protein COY98_03